MLRVCRVHLRQREDFAEFSGKFKELFDPIDIIGVEATFVTNYLFLL